MKLEPELELALFESARGRVVTAVERNRVGVEPRDAIGGQRIARRVHRQRVRDARRLRRMRGPSP